MSYAATYTSPGSSNVFIPWWQSSSSCKWATPCYKQFTYSYSWDSCKVWCSPLAMWIIFGYYDRNGYPNLVPWTAWLTNSYYVNNMIKTIWNLMNVGCYGNAWLTSLNNMPNWIQYAKNRWYNNAVALKNSSLTAWWVYNASKIEVNAWRPLMVNTNKSNGSDGHTTVVFWYKSSWTAPIVRINMGWWWYDTENWYYTSNLDQNLNSIFYNASYSHTPHSIVTIKMN